MDKSLRNRYYSGMARDEDDQPGSLWDAAAWAQARGEALAASGAVERHPASLAAAQGAQRAREALTLLRAHEPPKPRERPTERPQERATG